MNTSTGLTWSVLWDNIWEFLKEVASHLPRLVILLVIVVLLFLVLRIVLRRVAQHLLNKARVQDRLGREQQKRIQTIISIVKTMAAVLFWVIVVTVVLGEVGVDIGPIIATAGVLGLAVSFGAQSLVRDIIAGVFILAENQVRIGDVAVVNGTSGTVEAITLRTIVLRDATGTVHVFPNGTITTLANMTKDWSGYVFELRAGLQEDVDRVISVIRQAANELAADERFRDRILEPVEIFGLDRFDESAMVIKGRIKTLPIEQWNVGREFNRRIKAAFDAQGIAIPYTHRSLHFVEGPDPLIARLRPADRPMEQRSDRPPDHPSGRPPDHPPDKEKGQARDQA